MDKKNYRKIEELLAQANAIIRSNSSIADAEARELMTKVWDARVLAERLAH